MTGKRSLNLIRFLTASLFFILILVGQFRKLLFGRFLDISFDKSISSYWVKKPARPKADYNGQF